MGRLDKKIAVVFGAGSMGEGWGNGKATAVLYAREGAKILAVDRDPKAAKETADIIKSEGNEVISVEADVTRPAEVDRAIRAAVDGFGRVDILHNNVGIFEVAGLEQTDSDAWDRMMSVNVKGMFNTCKAALPIMVAQGSGVIVNLSSLGGVRWMGQPALAYHASKAAINRLTQSIAIEYARKGIRCNALMPGLITTPMTRDFYGKASTDSDARMKAREDAVPMGHTGTSWDVAHAALFLASDEAKYITGVLLPVDGGMMCKVG